MKLPVGAYFVVGICVGFLITYLTFDETGENQRIYRIVDVNTKIVGPRGTSNYSGKRIENRNQGNAKQPRVLCMILTSPMNHASKAIAVKETWAPRCTVHYFLSSEHDSNLPSVVAVEKEGRDSLWDKTKFGMRLALRLYGDAFDYLLKADDDTYIVMENLLHALKDFNPSDPILMGRRFKTIVRQGYPSGGAGYVISRSGVEKLVEGMKPGRRCGAEYHTWAEDVEIGKCAQHVGVRMVDSLDADGLERFHPFPLGSMITLDNNTADWLPKYNFHTLRNKNNCCSNRSISFHYVDPETMYAYDFMLYRLRTSERKEFVQQGDQH